MVIQDLKPSRRVEGRWLAVLEDGSILRLGEGEVVDFALYAGKELSEGEAEALTQAARRSGLRQKALNLLTSKPMSRRELERKLEQALAQIDGVGEVRVVLTLQSGPRRILAQDSQSTVDEGRTEAEVTNVVISAGSGVEGTVTLQQLSPQFQGALVVCSGGGEPTVQLRLVEAVSALTGLGADKISVCKGK